MICWHCDYSDYTYHNDDMTCDYSDYNYHDDDMTCDYSDCTYHNDDMTVLLPHHPPEVR